MEIENYAVRFNEIIVDAIFNDKMDLTDVTSAYSEAVRMIKKEINRLYDLIK